MKDITNRLGHTRHVSDTSGTKSPGKTAKKPPVATPPATTLQPAEPQESLTIVQAKAAARGLYVDTAGTKYVLAPEAAHGTEGAFHLARRTRKGASQSDIVGVKIVPKGNKSPGEIDPAALRGFEIMQRTGSKLSPDTILDLASDGLAAVGPVCDGPISSLRAAFHAADRETRENVIADVLMQTVTQMGRVHDEGFLHRDIKPDNLLYSRDGRVFLNDYGLAGREGRQAAAGSPGYMDLPALKGRPTPASDVWALAASMLELLPEKSIFSVSDVEVGVGRAGANDRAIRQIFAASKQIEAFNTWYKAAARGEPCDTPELAPISNYMLHMADELPKLANLLTAMLRPSRSKAPDTDAILDELDTLFPKQDPRVVGGFWEGLPKTPTSIDTHRDVLAQQDLPPLSRSQSLPDVQRAKDPSRR